MRPGLPIVLFEIRIRWCIACVGQVGREGRDGLPSAWQCGDWARRKGCWAELGFGRRPLKQIGALVSAIEASMPSTPPSSLLESTRLSGKGGESGGVAWQDNGLDGAQPIPTDSGSRSSIGPTFMHALACSASERQALDTVDAHTRTPLDRHRSARLLVPAYKYSTCDRYGCRCKNSHPRNGDFKIALQLTFAQNFALIPNHPLCNRSGRRVGLCQPA
ncbi:hypothetical protein L1887_55281 [Cichorium endivia]|nr:hypothetical protein L1887_55281 [Cichorium endivia]